MILVRVFRNQFATLAFFHLPRTKRRVTRPP